MTHEEFIELKTARLAKQAGFDWESRFDNQQQCDEWQQVALVEVSNPDYNDAMGDPYSDEFIPFMSPTKFVMLPHVTQAVLQRWLREVKNIYIDITVHENKRCVTNSDGWTFHYEYDEPTFDCEIKNQKGETIYIYMLDDTYNTYEAALEAGLQKCLTILSEKQ